MNGLEIIITTISASLVGIYHLHLYLAVRHRPDRTAIGMTNRLRQQWVETIMAERRDILAVQTLRNWVMASGLLASTSILIALGILSTVIRPAGFQEISHALNIAGTRSETLWVLQLMLLAVGFFSGFLQFHPGHPLLQPCRLWAGATRHQ